MAGVGRTVPVLARVWGRFLPESIGGPARESVESLCLVEFAVGAGPACVFLGQRTHTASGPRSPRGPLGSSPGRGSAAVSSCCRAAERRLAEREWQYLEKGAVQ